ncbi:MAG: Uma2 family endonuclease [Acetobacteraceae bacterium]
MSTAVHRDAPRHMTVDEFVDWAGDDRRPGWELVDGEPRAMAPANATHGVIQNNVSYTLTRHLRQIGSACRAVTEPAIAPRVRSSHNLRVPDVAVTCSAIPAGRLALPDPILVIEILSPRNEADTWRNVWTYVSIPSVREILVLHSTAVAADLVRRDADGTWPDEPVRIAESDTLQLDSIGLTCPLAELYLGTYLEHRA